MSHLQSTAGSTVAEVVSERISTLAEGPVWCEREETIYWVDILSGRLHMRRVADGSERSLEMGEHLGAVALREKGGLRSEEHTSELQSRGHLVCRLLLE